MIIVPLTESKSNQMGQTRLPAGAENIECTLTGMIPNQLHSIEVYSASGLLLSIEALTGLVMSDQILVIPHQSCLPSVRLSFH